MAYDSRLRQAALMYGREYGVDPALLVATTLVESGGRLDAVGDGGHSFGPYQMNRWGRLGATGFTRKQAEDPFLATREAAKEYASVKKRYGVSGAQLASDAQRPADRAGYQRKIDAAMGQARSIVGGGSGVADAALLNAPVTSGSGDVGSALGRGANTGAEVGMRQLAATALMNRRNGESLTRAMGRAVMQQRLSESASPAAPVDDGRNRAPSPAGGAGGVALGLQGSTGKYRLTGSPIDRPGAKTSQRVIDFMNQVSNYYGGNIQAGTGTQHNKYSTSGNVSHHWAGNALDLPASGSALIRMGRAALRAAGYKNWQNAPGGLYNLSGQQIIFGVNKGAASGGNHNDHLHVGLR